MSRGSRWRPVRIYDSNAYSIAAMVLANGGVPKRLGIAKDTVEALTAKLREGLDADMLVTSAGVSRGDYDVVKDVLAKEGEVDFWTVRMRPGKPLAFGAFASGGAACRTSDCRATPSARWCRSSCSAARPSSRCSGESDWQRPRVRAIAEESIPNTDGRRVFARAIVTQRDGRYYAALTGSAGLGRAYAMVAADVVPEDVPGVQPGDEVEVSVGPVYEISLVREPRRCGTAVLGCEREPQWHSRPAVSPAKLTNEACGTAVLAVPAKPDQRGTAPV